MLTAVLAGISVMLAWALALSFIRMKRTAVLFNAGIAGVLALIACWLMQQARLTQFFPAVLLGLFLIETAAVQLQNREGNYGDSIIAFCLAEGAFALFAPLCRMAQTQRPLPALTVFAAFSAAFAAAALLLSPLFPDSDWREYFPAGPSAPNRLNIRPVHIYAAAAAPCVGNSLLALFLSPAPRQAVPGSIAALALLLLGVWSIILMTSYKKERLAVLLEQQYRREMQSFMNVIRSQRHDYNFHVQTIAGLMAGNKIDECRAYVQALEKDSADMNEVMPVKDPAIAATIFSFRSLALRDGISLHIDIQNDLSQIATSVYETNKILSNLLQNAIDEVSAHKDKSYGIRLTILKRGEFCVIRVSNKVADIPTAKHLGMLCQQGYTTKKGHEGVGLSSIRSLAQRYHGIVYVQTEQETIHFIAKIPINTAKCENED